MAGKCGSVVITWREDIELRHTSVHERSYDVKDHFAV
jgi:hypothetical protein